MLLILGDTRALTSTFYPFCNALGADCSTPHLLGVYDLLSLELET